MTTPLGSAVLWTMVAGAVLAIVLGRYAWTREDVTGSRTFAVLMLVHGFLNVGHATALVLRPGVQQHLVPVLLVAQVGSALLWFLFVLEYTGFDRFVSRRQIFGLASFTLLLTLCFWVPGIAPLFREPYRVETIGRLGLTTVTFDPRAGALVLTAVSYGLGLVSQIILGVFVVQSRGRYRWQALIVFVAALAYYATAVAQIAGATPFYPVDHTRLIFVAFAAGIALALYRYGFLETLPLVSRELLGEMDDAVLLVDDTDRIVDHNPAAEEVFPVSDPLGHTLEELAPDLPAAIQSGGRYVIGRRKRIADGGVEAVYEPKVTPVTDRSGTDRGRLIVLRDVTELHKREVQLEDLQSVLSRVLRHDLRTELNLVRGHAESIASNGTDAAAAAEAIVEASERLEDTGYKARRVENVILDASETAEIDIREAVERVLTRADTADATVRTNLPAGSTVLAHPETPFAIECIVENALEHVENPTIEVDAERSGGAVDLRVADDGPGIPPRELSVIEAGYETQLEHASGVGLWLARTVARASRGDLAFDSSDDGTTVTLRLPAGPAASSEADPVGERTADELEPEHAPEREAEMD